MQFSAIRAMRPGFGRSTQLLATEIYDVLARGQAADRKASDARLVSFADSRQAAARTALDVENLHHRDLLRELLMVTLLEVDTRRTQSNAIGQARLHQIDAEIEEWRANADLSDVESLQQLQASLAERSTLASEHTHR